MTTGQLRKHIQKAVKAVPPDRLATLAEYVDFLSRTPLRKQIAKSERDLAAGKGVNWRTVRNDV